MMLGFTLVGWPLAVLAWRPLAPAGWRGTVLLAAALIGFDLVLDAWLATPAVRRLSAPQWEALRMLALVAASLVAARIPHRAWARRSLLALRAVAVGPPVLLVALIVTVAVSGTREETAPGDAALVLGYALDPTGQPQPSLVARIDHAADLHRRGLVAHLIVSGGAARAGVREADAMRELLVARGVPDQAILLESRARSTEENFACAAPILRQLAARRVLLVTEPWHMARAQLQSRPYLAGLELRRSPATSPAWRSARTRSARLTGEAIAYLMERVRQTYRPLATCPGQGTTTP
jgi:uncharacterized SAM-binding protein YcdF (DUF218 family)